MSPSTIQEAFDEVVNNTNHIDFVRREYSESIRQEYSQGMDIVIRSAATTMILLFDGDSSLAKSRIFLINSISENYIALRLTDVWAKKEFFTLRTLLMKFIVLKHLRGVRCTESIGTLYDGSSNLLEDIKAVVRSSDTGLKSIVDQHYSSFRSNVGQLNGGTFVQLQPVGRGEDGTVRPMDGGHPMALYQQQFFGWS